LLNAAVREAAAKMFAVPERVGVAEAVGDELGVEVVLLPQAAASIVRQATTAMQQVLLEMFTGSPSCWPGAPPRTPSLTLESIGLTASEQLVWRTSLVGSSEAPRSDRDGGDAVVRGETGDQTGQESRSVGHRAAASMTAMESM
jgi:hypothetical protein